MDHEVAQLAGFDPFFSGANQVQLLGSGEVVDGWADGFGQPLQQTGKKFVAQRVLQAPEAGDERIDSLPQALVGRLAKGVGCHTATASCRA